MELKDFKNIKLGTNNITTLRVGGQIIWTSGEEPSPTNVVEVDLNDEWVVSTKTLDGYSVYMSNSNYNVNSGWASMKLTIKNYPDFKLYINSYAESTYDYTVAFKLDVELPTTEPAYDTSGVLASTRGIQNDPSGGISNFTELPYSNDGAEHFIWICYRKDGSRNSNDDRGYIAFQMEMKYYKQVLIEDDYYYEDGEYYEKYEKYGSPDGVTWYPTGEYSKGNVLQKTTEWDGTSLWYEDGKLYQKLSVSVVLPNGSTIVTGNYQKGDYVKDYELTEQNGLFYTTTDSTLIEPTSSTAFGDANYLGTITYDTSNVFMFDSDLSVIGSSAFTSKSTLKSVTQKYVTSVGSYAFRSCYYLNNVDMPSLQYIGYYAFANCHYSLAEISLHNVQSFGNFAFQSCSSLNSIYMYNATSIPYMVSYYVFSSCNNLKYIYVPSSLYETWINSSPWNIYSSVILPYEEGHKLKVAYKSGTYTTVTTSTTAIPYLYQYKIAFASIYTVFKLSDSTATELKASAFYGLQNLSSVDLPNVRSVGMHALRSTVITSINLPLCNYDYTGFAGNGTITTASYGGDGLVLNSTFSDCAGLEAVYTPHLSSIGKYTFYNCSNLHSWYMHELSSVPYMGSYWYSIFSSSYRRPLIYVPSSMYSLSLWKTVQSSYSYWPALWSNFVPYTEEMHYINLYNTDGTSLSYGFNTNYVPVMYSINGFSTMSSVSYIELPTQISALSSPLTPFLNVVSVYAPELLVTDSYFLHNHSLLLSASLPKLTNLGYGGFSQCSALPSIHLPECESISAYAFLKCENLSVANIPVCQYINNSAFLSCEALAELYLNDVSKVTTLGGSNVFDSCPALTSIYVPTSLVEAFQSAEYWSSLADKFVGV